jgi:phosphate transport system substrate-binding protein
VSLVGAGASFPYPLYSKWFSEYAEANPGVQISYQSIGSGGGIQQLKARTVDFGASDAPLSDEEAKSMPGPVVHIPTIAGAVAVAYNLPGLEQPLKLDGRTLAAIYSGEVRRWTDQRIAVLNPAGKLPDLAIAVVHRSDGSGTSYLFTSYLAAVSKDWSTKVGAGKSVNWPTGVGAKGNEGVTGVVKQTPGAIGYLELAYAKQSDLPAAHLKNAAGEFVEPTVASTTAAAAGAADTMRKDVRVSLIDAPAPGAYPIAGFTYLLMYQQQTDQRKAEAMARFLLWALKDGQQLAPPLLYAPLPEQVVHINESAVRGLTYQGKPVLPER